MARTVRLDASDYSSVKSMIGTGQAKTASATSVSFSALPECAGFRIDAEVDCWVEVGATAVASTSTHLFGGQVEYLKAKSGDVVQVLAAGTAGLVYIRPFE